MDPALKLPLFACQALIYLFCGMGQNIGQKSELCTCRVLRLDLHLGTAAVTAACSSRAPSAAGWADGPCRAVCDRGRFPTTAPAAAARLAAFPGQPRQAGACVPPRAETPPAGTICVDILQRAYTQQCNKHHVWGQYIRHIHQQHMLVTDLVKVLAEQCSGLWSRQVTEFGHEVHLPLGEHAGWRPQLSLPLSDGLVLILDSCIQSLDCLIKLEQCSLLLKEGAQVTWIIN